MKSYAQAGVDVGKVRKLHDFINNLIASTKNKETLPVYGHYAGLLKIGGATIAIHTDGVGTKVLVAQQQDRYDTVGIDAVAMNANDIICMGARPVSLVDYIALEKEDEFLITELLKGVVAGAKECGASIVGGETAIMGDVIKGLPGKTGFDLAATMLGVIEGEVVTGQKMKPGDAVVGLESSGIHSNGLTLARKVLGPEWGAELLTPTRIYAKAVMEIIKKTEVHGMAHVTGGAFSKLERIGKQGGTGFLLDALPEPLPIFKAIQESSNATDSEMHRTFNMGVGFCIVVPEDEAEAVVSIARKNKAPALRIGVVTREKQVTVVKKGRKMVL